MYSWMPIDHMYYMLIEKRDWFRLHDTSPHVYDDGHLLEIRCQSHIPFRERVVLWGAIMKWAYKLWGSNLVGCVNKSSTCLTWSWLRELPLESFHMVVVHLRKRKPKGDQSINYVSYIHKLSFRNDGLVIKQVLFYVFMSMLRWLAG